MKHGQNDNAASKPQSAGALAGLRKTAAHRLIQPIVALIAKTGLTPNHLTIVGLLINIGAAAAIVTHHLLPGGFLILFSGLFDMLDGALARATKQATRFGALFDSTVDRLAEGILLCALMMLYLGQGSMQGVILSFAVMIGSFLVSYIRARAQGLGTDCPIGLFTRSERVIVLALGLLLDQVLIALWILAILTCVTVIQRLFYARQQLRD